MYMIIQDLQKANIEAMKAHDTNARSILSVVISRCKLLEVELRSKGQELKDEDVLGIIQKILKELADEKEGYVKTNNLERAQMIDEQAEIIKIYLPKQLSEEEILEEINKLEDKSIPSIMKHFKTNFAGKVDMSLVSKVSRGL